MEALSSYSSDDMNRLKTKYHIEELISETSSEFEAVQAVSEGVIRGP